MICDMKRAKLFVFFTISALILSGCETLVYMKQDPKFLASFDGKEATEGLYREKIKEVFNAVLDTLEAEGYLIEEKSLESGMIRTNEKTVKGLLQAHVVCDLRDRDELVQVKWRLKSFQTADFANSMAYGNAISAIKSGRNAAEIATTPSEIKNVNEYWNSKLAQRLKGMKQKAPDKKGS